MAEGNPFLEAGTDSILLDDLTLAGRPSVLERLGPASFRSKGFSLIGFLQTLYDHVAEQSNGHRGSANAAAPADSTPFAQTPPTEATGEPIEPPAEETLSASPFDHSLGI